MIVQKKYPKVSKSTQKYKRSIQTQTTQTTQNRPTIPISTQQYSNVFKINQQYPEVPKSTKNTPKYLKLPKYPRST